MLKNIIIVAIIVLLGVECKSIFGEKVDMENEGVGFSDIEKIKVDIIDAPIVVIENDVQEIIVSSTVMNTGVGIVTQPSIWERKGVLYFHQGYAIGYNTESTGTVTVEIPKGMDVDIDIKSGSGDVFVSTSASTNILIDAAVGEKTIVSTGENLLIKSDSGNINIDGVFTNTEINTINSDVKMYADADTSQIHYKSISGNATIMAQGVRGCNLLHEYAGGRVDEYFSLEGSSEKIFEVCADTIDGCINIINDDVNRNNL